MAASWWRSQTVFINLFASLLQILDFCHQSIILTFSTHMPIKSPMLSKAPMAPWTLERLLSGVMADVAHQRTFLPEASCAIMAHIRFLVAMSPLMHLQGILRKMRRYVKDCTKKVFYVSDSHPNTNIDKITLVLYPLLHLVQW